MSLTEVTSVFYNIFSFYGICSMGCLLGYCVAAIGTHHIKGEEIIIPFIQKYYYKYKNLDDREILLEELENLLNTYVTEDTSKGKITLRYNHINNGYDYWCDNKSIDYSYLEAVAHKYSIINNCKTLCIDYKEEFELAQEEIASRLKELECSKPEEVQVEKTKKNVFAKFKSYNTTVNKEDNDNKCIIPKKSNKYRYIGNIYMWNHTVNDKKPQKNQIDIKSWLLKRKKME